MLSRCWLTPGHLIWNWCVLPLLLLAIVIQLPCWASPPDSKSEAQRPAASQSVNDETPVWRAWNGDEQEDAVHSRMGVVLQADEPTEYLTPLTCRGFFRIPNLLGEDQWTEDEEIPPKWRLVRAQNEPPRHDQELPISESIDYQRTGENVPYAFPFIFGGDKIEVTSPKEDPYLPIFESASPGSIFDLNRPNLIDSEVPDQWDFYNLINTDRPDFTDATYSVGKNIVLIESGYTFTRTRTDGMNINRGQLPEMLVRMGLTNEFELRFRWNGYILNDYKDAQTGASTQNFGGNDLNLGIKYEVLQQEQWRPMVTIVTGTTIPTGTNGVSARQLQPYFNTVLGWGIRRWLYLKASSGVEFDKGGDPSRILPGSPLTGPILVSSPDNVTLWHASTSLLYQASPRVGGFLEWYSFFSANAVDNRPAHYIDTGFYFYATPNVQYDIRVGQRLSDRVDTLFTGAGVSFRY
ncbi:MAG: transporter [Planctomycetaceae bacterium]|nr:transporter [Planctomycetaceae bacterium]